MDLKLAALQNLLRDIGATQTLRVLRDEAPPRGKPFSMGSFAGSNPRPPKLSHSRFDFKQHNDFDTTKSLTPDPPQKHLGFRDGSKTGFDVGGRERPRQLEQGSVSDIAEGDHRGLLHEEISPLRKISFDRSENSCSHDISFGEESICSITPEKKPILGAGRTAPGSNPTASLFFTSGGNPFAPHIEAQAPADFPKTANTSRGSQRFQNEISQVVARASRTLVKGAEDRMTLAYQTRVLDAPALLASLRPTHQHLFHSSNDFTGYATDEAMVRRVSEETRVLKIELRTFFNVSSDASLVRDKYRIERALTTSTFSHVFACSNVHTGRQYVLKRIKADKTFFDQSLLEAAVLFYLRKKGSPARHHFLEIVECFHYNGCLHIVTETLGGSLYDEIVKPKKTATVAELQAIMQGLLVCLRFLKEHGVIHCDIKPENVLLRGSLTHGVKLIDFGSATFANDVDFDYIQTRPYRAPEVVLGCPFDFAVDMWSLGCLAYELVTHRVLFSGKSMQENLVKAMAVSRFFALEDFARSARHRPKSFVTGNAVVCGVDPNARLVVARDDYDLLADLAAHDCSPALADLIRQCLQMDPARRISVEEALEHPFINAVFD